MSVTLERCENGMERAFRNGTCLGFVWASGDGVFAITEVDYITQFRGPERFRDQEQAIAWLKREMATREG